MEDKILMIIPSRDRPESIKELFKTFEAYSTNRSRLLVALDDDNDFKYNRIPGIHYTVDKRLGCMGTLNKVALKFVDEYRYLGFMGDDHRFRTDGWDEILIQKLEEKGINGIVYANDLYPYNDLPTSVVMNSHVVKELGYMVPPVLKHMYADNFWLELGTALGSIAYVPEVIIEHMHYSVGKSEKDESYQETTPLMQQDAEEYAGYKKFLFQYDVDKLRGTQAI